MEATKSEGRGRDDIFSKVVRAGRRTYFFDVKATRNDDYYLTLTESKKNTQEDGTVHYEKHKVFLYKEDFDKFVDGLTEAISYIKEHKGDDESAVQAVQSDEASTENKPESETENDTYSAGISFDDLSK
ncbi:uncharacterized protein DUF3276 [Balneicella halophila]|uniref:Uncharacterized protein DUF3276 n=1 Tax=Balneicella halophila TaxID=1537566 RepID=A0A7L4URJ4_BALHA|nr:DUF3276 family protein [Balneicella halophila]PVX52386.1 uncharacterized protein DUF3276 [Balneicella halophila]